MGRAAAASGIAGVELKLGKRELEPQPEWELVTLATRSWQIKIEGARVMIYAVADADADAAANGDANAKAASHKSTTTM